MKEFLKSFLSWKVALNLLATIFVFVATFAAVYFSLGSYTHHNEKVDVPNIKKKSFNTAKHDLHKLGLEIQVTDTLYLKNLPANIILEQMPAPGKTVKPGRVIYVVINAGHSPIKPIPDIIDNSSAREAKAKLLALGFKRVEMKYIAGEKDWVYGLSCNGKKVNNGEMVSVEARLVLLVGDGARDLGDSIATVQSNYYFDGLEDEYASSGEGRNRSGGSSSEGSSESYSQEQVEQEIDDNLDAELERMIRERHSQKYDGGAEAAPAE